MNDFPVIDTVPLENEKFSTPFETWLSNLVTELNDMFFVGKYTYVGGSASFDIDIPNVVPGFIAFAQVESSNNLVSVQKVTPGVDKITVTLSGNPGASVISYAVFRI